MKGYDEGQKLKREEKSRNALATLFGGGSPPVGQTPGTFPTRVDTVDPVLAPGGGIGGGRQAGGIPWNDLTPEDARTAIAYQGRFQDQQATQAKRQQDQLTQMGRLLSVANDEASYQQSLAAAKQIGIDTSRAPANYDPNWVGQQKLVLSAFEKDGGQQISGIERELIGLGYKRGTPQFQQAFKMALEGKYAGTYTDDKGNVRQKQLPDLPQPEQSAQGIPAVGMIEDGHRFKGGNPADPSAWEPIGQAQPQMTVSPRELDALVNKFGPEEVQRRLDSGAVVVGN